MTVTSSAVRIVSSPSAVTDGTCGFDTPASTAEPKAASSTMLATIAPASWAVTYAASQRTGNSRRSVNPRVTAGLKWAPDESPRAYTKAITRSAGAAARATAVTSPPVMRPATSAPAATKVSANVPASSARSLNRSGGSRGPSDSRRSVGLSL